MMMDECKSKAQRFLKLYEKQVHYGQMQIFQLKNENFELKDVYIDLHGLKRQEAVAIIRVRLREIQHGLDLGEITPSTSDGANHVVKIVCGAGNHS